MMLLLIRKKVLVMLLLRYPGRTLLNLLRLLIFLMLLLGTRFVGRRRRKVELSLLSMRRKRKIKPTVMVSKMWQFVEPRQDRRLAVEGG
ncbi:hypothetical protein ANAPC1_01232 [Anaplasma phagocytophilum]|uniref:Uncharacterized protein n=1 Tax=Anaplasma phagocytophilum TaxID=948 RepID=A0AA45ZHX9_ANAPH|nr:hypothetical protein ANAPC1_01232 [Anaplasma phagocytophilum]